MAALTAVFVSTQLVRLSAVGFASSLSIFLLVLAIRFYLKRFANTGERFFSGRPEMTSLVLCGRAALDL